MSQLATSSMLHVMREDGKPIEEIMEAVGDISAMDVVNDAVLIGIYIQQGMTKGGLVIARLSIESAYQGKVGLVLKTPRGGYSTHTQDTWAGKPPKVGEWVYFRPSNGDPVSVCGEGAVQSKRLDDLGINLVGWPCLIMGSEFIMGRIKEPRSIV